MSAKSPLPLIFVHIPKTGGSTFHDILSRQYSAEESYACRNVEESEKVRELSSSEKQNIRVITGHFSLRIAGYIPQKMLLLTLLRDPIQRTISHFYYIRRLKEHPLHKEITQNNYSLRQVFEKGLVKNLDNCQVRFLSDAHEVPFGEIGETHYQTAIKNLDHLIHSYGLVEYYDESVLLFQEELQWKLPLYASRNVTKKTEKGHKEPYPEELLERYNNYDLRLYDYAKAKFLDKIRSKGPAFQNKVRRFRLMNRCFAWLAFMKRRIFD